MSDFVNSGWSAWVTVISILGVVFVLWLLWTQRSWLGRKTVITEDTGHEWDGIRELNHPLPRWWIVMYLGLCVIGVAVMLLYPALGGWNGLKGWSSAEQVVQEQQQLREAIAPVYARFEGKTVEELAKDPEARLIGERLFLNTCAQCHGSDARGSTDFPNLTDNDWLGGDTPEYIHNVITNGRVGIMAPLGAALGANAAEQNANANAIAHYVRSLSGLSADATLIAKGQQQFGTVCVACHGVDAKGNHALGAPNLTDDIWLGSSSHEAIVRTINEGRMNIMPPQKDYLTPEQVDVLTAYIWSIANIGD